MVQNVSGSGFRVMVKNVSGSGFREMVQNVLNLGAEVLLARHVQNTFRVPEFG